jgi:hypothetical protein
VRGDDVRVPLVASAGVTLSYSPGATLYPWGEVQLDGAVSGAGIPAGIGSYTQVAVLPAGFRPAKYQYYPVTVGGSTAQASLRVQTTGEIELAVSPATTGSVALTGIRFAAS